MTCLLRMASLNSCNCLMWFTLFIVIAHTHTHTHTHIYIYIWPSPSWEANRSSSIQEIPSFYGTRNFITVFTNARHLSLSGARSMESIPPHSTSWIPILILSTHLHLGLPSSLFLSGFPTKTLYTSLLSPLRVSFPVHLIILDFINRTTFGKEYRSWNYSLCSFLHFPWSPRFRINFVNKIDLCNMLWRFSHH